MSADTSMSTGERKRGECKWFNSKKGFGFITPADGSEDVFVHQSEIKAEGFRSLAEKEPVEYETVIDENSRVKATKVTGPGGAYVRGAPKPQPRMYREGGDEGGYRPRGGRVGGGGGGFRGSRDQQSPQ